LLIRYIFEEERSLDERFDHGTMIHGTKRSVIELRRWITTIDGKCPECSSHSLIKYIDDKVIIGCLVCGWKETDSIDRANQKALDNLQRTLDHSKRMLDNLQRTLERKFI
jgi:Zn ribbon nucleic-acid-binding protein